MELTTEQLKARIAELEKDKARLDWLCTNGAHLEYDHFLKKPWEVTDEGGGRISQRCFISGSHRRSHSKGTRKWMICSCMN